MNYFVVSIMGVFTCSFIFIIGKVGINKMLFLFLSLWVFSWCHWYKLENCIVWPEGKLLMPMFQKHSLFSDALTIYPWEFCFSVNICSVQFCSQAAGFHSSVPHTVHIPNGLLLSEMEPLCLPQLQVRSKSQAGCEAWHPATPVYRLQAILRGLPAAPAGLPAPAGDGLPAATAAGLQAAPADGLQAALPWHQAVPPVWVQAAPGTSRRAQGSPFYTEGSRVVGQVMDVGKEDATMEGKDTLKGFTLSCYFSVEEMTSKPLILMYHRVIFKLTLCL